MKGWRCQQQTMIQWWPWITNIEFRMCKVGWPTRSQVISRKIMGKSTLKVRNTLSKKCPLNHFFEHFSSKFDPWIKDHFRIFLNPKPPMKVWGASTHHQVADTGIRTWSLKHGLGKLNKLIQARVAETCHVALISLEINHATNLKPSNCYFQGPLLWQETPDYL